MLKLRIFIGDFIWYSGDYLNKFSNYKLLKLTDVIKHLGNKIAGNRIDVK